MAAYSPPTKRQRALPASIFLVLAATCFYLMDIPTLFVKYPPPNISIIANGKVSPIKRFHWIAFLDQIFKDVVVGFVPSSFGLDDVSRWQMYSFSADIGVIYTMLCLESLRNGIKGGPVWYPTMFATLAQVGGGGVILSAYYFFNIVYGVPSRSTEERKINISGTWILAIGALIFCNAPLAGIMFAPSLEQRHWCIWFWQLYPVRTSLFYYTVISLGKFISFPKLGSNLGYQAILRFALAPFILSAATMWIYTMVNCPYPLRTWLWPQPISDSNVFDANTWVERMRRTLVFDQLFMSGSALIWLASSAKRLKELIMFCTISVVLVGLVGPGATVGVMWCVRETSVERKTNGKAKGQKKV